MIGDEDHKSTWFTFWGKTRGNPEDEAEWVRCLDMHNNPRRSAVIIPDIQGYVSAAVDKESGKHVRIGSRKQHREFLNRNDYVEVGNDFTPPKQESGDAPMVSAEEMKKMGLVEADL